MSEGLAGFLTIVHANDQSYLSTQTPSRQHRRFKMADEVVEVISQRTNQKRKKSWKDDEVVKLIESYESRPCLWDTFNKEYHHSDKRAIALSEIEELLGIPREECQQKWNNLKGQYSREMHQMSKMKSGSGVEERYETKWKFFNHLKFLELVVEARKSQDTLVARKKVDDQNSCEGASFFFVCLPCFCLFACTVCLWWKYTILMKSFTERDREHTKLK